VGRSERAVVCRLLGIDSPLEVMIACALEQHAIGYMHRDADMLSLQSMLGRPASDRCKQAGYMLTDVQCDVDSCPLHLQTGV